MDKRLVSVVIGPEHVVFTEYLEGIGERRDFLATTAALIERAQASLGVWA